MDELLLATAVRMKTDHPWQGDSIPECVAFEAGFVIEREVGVQLSPLEINQRLTILEARYLTFTKVVGTPGTSWVPSMQNVVALDDCWMEIIKKHPLASDYYHRDEPEFHQLCILFGWGAVKTEGRSETIVISDSIDDVPFPAALDVVGEVEVEEVNSHQPCRTTMIRRKLFCEDEDSLDRESTNASPDGGLVRKLSNSIHRRPLREVKKPTYSPGVSSTASCSPFAPYRKTLP